MLQLFSNNSGKNLLSNRHSTLRARIERIPIAPYKPTEIKLTCRVASSIGFEGSSPSQSFDRLRLWKTSLQMSILKVNKMIANRREMKDVLYIPGPDVFQQPANLLQVVQRHVDDARPLRRQCCRSGITEAPYSRHRAHLIVKPAPGLLLQLPNWCACILHRVP